MVLLNPARRKGKENIDVRLVQCLFYAKRKKKLTYHFSINTPVTNQSYIVACTKIIFSSIKYATGI